MEKNIGNRTPSPGREKKGRKKKPIGYMIPEEKQKKEYKIRGHTSSPGEQIPSCKTIQRKRKSYTSKLGKQNG